MTDDLTPREVGPRPSANFPAVDPARDLPAAVALLRRVAAERHPYDGVLLGMAADVLEAAAAGRDRVALVPSIEAALFAPLTEVRWSTLDDRLRPLVARLLDEWAGGEQAALEAGGSS